MRASLLLIAVRAGTAIVVSTAAVQFWAIAVKGETPRLTPSLALPPTATAVAAVVPHRNVKPKKLHPAKHKVPSKAEAHPTSSSPPAAVTQPASAPEPAAAPRQAQPDQQLARKPVPANRQVPTPAPKPKPSPSQAAPAPAQPVLTRPPAFPQLTPVPPPPPADG